MPELALQWHEENNSSVQIASCVYCIVLSTIAQEVTNE